MKYILSVFCGALVYFFMSSVLYPGTAYADVRINEIAWMSTPASQYSEWIELYNSGTDVVSLAGWKLYKTGDELFFTLSKTIAADRYLLVERTTASAPDAVPGISDKSGTFTGGGLKNSGEDFTLKDQDGNVIESLLFAGGWPAGDARQKRLCNGMAANGLLLPAPQIRPMQLRLRQFLLVPSLSHNHQKLQIW